ncbi:MAG: hypothetical protein RI897_3916 [Verrucomicrobiota bacterium]
MRAMKRIGCIGVGRGRLGSWRSLGGFLGMGLVAVVLATGCGRRAVVEEAETPRDTVEIMVEELAANRPQVLWEALPPSYQQDIRDLIVEFCNGVDVEAYDRAFRVLDKGVRVLEQKKEFIFNSPLTLNNPLIDSSIGMNWELSVGMFRAFVESEVSSVESLRAMDPGMFLAKTGSRIMGDMEELARLSPRADGTNPLLKAREAMTKAQIEFVPGEAGQGYLTFATSDAEGSREVKMVQVEGRWVPAEMAETWKGRVAEAKVGLAGMGGEGAEKMRPMVQIVLNTLDGTMDSLLAAKSQQEFDAVLGAMQSMGQLMQRFRPGSGAGPEKPETVEEVGP